MAATLVKALEFKVDNFLVLSAFKLIPPAMIALASSEQTNIDGFICPGHVSTIIGTDPYGALAKEHGMPCVVTGFEPLDIIEGISMLLKQIGEGASKVANQYKRVVRQGGNRTALNVLERVFSACDAHWRGIGVIEDSGLMLKEEFLEFDAQQRVPVEVQSQKDLPKGCSCGEVIRGLITPTECPLFAKSCKPEHPIGPCMVSSEGACAAYYNFGG